MVLHTFSPVIKAEEGRSLSLRSAWSTEPVPGGLHKEVLSWREKKEKIFTGHGTHLQSQYLRGKAGKSEVQDHLELKSTLKASLEHIGNSAKNKNKNKERKEKPTQTLEHLSKSTEGLKKKS